MSVASVGFAPTPVSSEINRVQTQARTQPARQQEAVQNRPEERRARPREAASSTAADLQRLVFDRRLQFVVDQSSREVIVKVIDRDTDKVIKELPPEELQRMHNNLRESIGFLFDESV